MKASAEGWYGPAGQFAPCCYGQHENTAVFLCDTAKVAGWPEDCQYARDALTRAGWVYVGGYLDEDVVFAKDAEALRLVEAIAPEFTEETVFEFGESWTQYGELRHVRFSPSEWRESGESFLDFVRGLLRREGLPGV